MELKVDRNEVVDRYRKRRSERLNIVEKHDAVEEYRKRRYHRVRMDANVGWAYGVAKGKGIDVTGMSPSEVFEALKEAGVDTENGGAENNEPKYLTAHQCATAKTVGGYKRKNIDSFKKGYRITSAAGRDGLYAGSMRKNTDRNGMWTPKREALHSQIIDDTFEGIKKAEGKPVTVFMGGGPACGKSTVIKSVGEKLGLPKKDECVVVDADKCKARLPEYDPKEPGYVHEESSALARRIVRLSQENGYNTIVDGTGDGSVWKMREKIRQAKEAGNTVNGVYVFTDIDNAIYQNFKRERSVDTRIVVDTHMAIPEILPRIASDFDNVKLYANMMDGNPPVLVAEGGGGKPLRVIDEKYYKKFMDNRYYQYDNEKVMRLKKKANG